MEFKRILLSKSFLFLLIVLLLISAYFFIYQNTLTNSNILYYGNTYDKFITDFSELSFEEGYEKCVEYDERATMQMIEGTWEWTEESSINLEIICKLKEQYAHLMEYEDYLVNIQKNAERLQATSLFSDNSSFSYKNTVKTAKDFSDLSSENVTLCHDLAVTNVFKDNWTDIISIIPIFLVCCLFLSERKNRLNVLVFATPAGRTVLALKRVVILFLVSIITVIVLFGSRILFNGYLYHGLNEWGEPLQSISVFYNVPYKMTIGTFWIWYLAIKTLGIFFVGLVIWLIQIRISNFSAAVGIMGIIIGVEFAFTSIPLNSLFVFLRYINIFSYINYFPVFTKYFNVSVFGYVISGNEASCIMLLIFCLIFPSVIVCLAQKQYPVNSKKIQFAGINMCKEKLAWLFSGGNLFMKEAKKLLLYRRGVIVLLIMIILLSQFGVPVRKETRLDMYLDYYKEKYAGPITDTAMNGLQEELSAAKEPERVAALKQLISEYSIAADDAWIVPSAPYDALFNVQKYHYTVALTAILFLILLVSPLFSQEKQSGMMTLINSTPAGRFKLWMIKHSLLFGCAFLVWLLVYGSEIIRLIDVYGSLSCMDAPLSSFPNIEFNVWHISIAQMLVLLYALRFAVLLTVAEICSVFSLLCERNSNAIIVNCSIVLIPAALAAIGSFIGKRLSVLMPLTVIDLGPTVFPYLILLSVFSISIALSGYIFMVKKN